ncbi:hypothetical protein E2C01_050740 [Portunus trituberculatus]|uniref:Uncharacterized protein n=1 Tax=Portunus trituberculatus TaxID=210409 RepID=A0A5B7GHA6_PORTR|nr:hypothetical protein [Portunus trituberculatus]
MIGIPSWVPEIFSSTGMSSCWVLLTVVVEVFWINGILSRAFLLVREGVLLVLVFGCVGTAVLHFVEVLSEVFFVIMFKMAVEAVNTVENEVDGFVNRNISKEVSDVEGGKTHKTNNPLHSIIYQVPTPTYAIAKKLNQLLTLYISNKYCLNSATDYLEILRDASTEENSIIASLDVESLFTKVPVDKIINFILDRVYRFIRREAADQDDAEEPHTIHYQLRSKNPGTRREDPGPSEMSFSDLIKGLQKHKEDRMREIPNQHN